MIKTIYEAHDAIKKLVEKKEFDNAIAVMQDCQDAVIEIGNVIEESEGEDVATISLLTDYCKEVYDIAQELESLGGRKIQKLLDAKLISAENSVKNDIPVKLEIVFCPYKASMWDSLESIWRAADNDPNCDAYVVAAPYYDRNPDYSFGAFHYEGERYPDYVPIIHYDGYDFAKRMPDIVYIHNPYDDNNIVTSVDPRFYSFELKKYTDCLVYVPYHITTSYYDFSTAESNIAPAFYNVDYFITQSNNQKEYFAFGGISRNKMLTLGSPKADFVVNNFDSIEVPSKWKEITDGKVTFMLNTSIAYLLRVADWGAEMNKLIDYFSKDDSCALIWRPHPLLEATIRSMRPAMLDDYYTIIERIKKCSNIIFDTEDSAYPAMKISDALISDVSSLVLQFSLTNKPTLLTDSTVKQRESDVINFDFFENYFVEDGVTISDFIDMIKKGEDEKKSTRPGAIYASLANADGTSGQKIHDTIIDLI